MIDVRTPKIMFLPLLLLAACHGGDAPGGATPGEAQALNDAAASLDATGADTNDAVIVDESEGGNEDQAQ